MKVQTNIYSSYCPSLETRIILFLMNEAMNELFVFKSESEWYNFVTQLSVITSLALNGYF